MLKNMTMKYFILTNNTEYELTRPVCDMAAFFDYQLLHDVSQLPDGEPLAVVSLTHTQGRVEAVIEQGGAEFRFGVDCQQGADEYGDALASGEVKRCVKIAVYEAFCILVGSRTELPWGILTGVRQGKLAHKLIDGGVAFDRLADTLERNYLLPPKQGNLLTGICRLQKQLVADDERFCEAGIYVGIPFCPSRCTYCSFPAGIVPQDEESQQNFVNLIEQDIENVVQLISMHSLRVTSLYIGGGTPTSLNDRVFARLLAFAEKLKLPTVKEFTVEAGRPDCFSAAKLSAMESAGVNRISVNPQTFRDRTLRLIGRRHTVDDFYRAYEMVRKSSIPVINMDLIIGLPGENEADVLYSYEEAARLDPENLTIHTLTLKRGAELFGSQVKMEPETAGSLVEKGMEAARAMGMHPYYLYRQHYMLGHLANIGYAKPGTESIYNIQMMEERHPVIGIGPASASKVPLRDGHHLEKLNMPRNVRAYSERLEELFMRRQELFKL